MQVAQESRIRDNEFAGSEVALDATRLDLVSAVRYSAVLASAGAGFIHLAAARGHAEHLLVFAFFIGAGVLQLAWGAGTFLYARARALHGLGLANLFMVAVWGVSRTTGIPFVPGAESAEHIHAPDLIATGFELVVAACAVALIWPGSRLERPLPLKLGDRMLASIGAIVLALTVIGVVSDYRHLSDHGSRADHAVHTGQPGDAHAPGAPVHEGHAATGTNDHIHLEAAGAAQQGTHGHEPGGTAPSRPQKVAPALEVGGGTPVILRYGPWMIPPASLNEATHTSLVIPNVAKPCSDCFITSFSPNLVYEDGTNANLSTGPMLHHAVWRQSGRADTTCGNSRQDSPYQGERFFASGNERTSVALPRGFGYYVNNSPWHMILELMNHKQEPKTVYVALTMTHVPASSSVNRVTPVWMDINNCRSSVYSVPAGPAHHIYRWTSNITGRVIATGGHVHDGGIKTVLTNETTGKEMCTSWAGYGRNPEFIGSVESMSTCVWDRIGTLAAGEAMGIHSYYDSPVPLDDAMGINIAYVYETADLHGGSDPPSSVQSPEPENQGAPKEHPH